MKSDTVEELQKKIRALENQNEQLRESNNKFKTLYENAPLPYQSLDIDGNIIDVNPSWMDTLGYERDEVIGKPFSSFLHDEWKPHFDKNFPAFKKRGYVHDVQFWMKHKKGHHIIVTFEGCIGYKPDGSFRQTYCVFKDITHQNDLENQLRKNEKQLQITLNSIGDAVISTEQDGTIVQMNKVAEELTGWKFEEAKGKQLKEVFKIVNAYTGSKIQNPVKKVLEDGEVTGMANHTKLLSKDGNEYQIADTAAPIIDTEGKLHGVVTVFRDVTEEYKKNHQLKEQKEFLDSVLNSIQDGISVLNLDLTIQYMNPVMEQWYTNLDTVKGQKCYSCFHGKSEPCNSCPTLKSIQTKKVESEIVPYYKRKESHESWLEVHSYPVVDSVSNEVKRVVEFVRDVTKRKETEKELKRIKELLEKTQEIAHLGSWELDLEKNILYWSDETYRIFGLEPNEFEATYEAFLERVYPEDREKVANAYEVTVKKGKERYEIEHRIVRAHTGEIRYVREVCEHKKDAEGKVVKSIGMVQDITDQKKAEIELKEKNEELIAAEEELRVSNEELYEINQKLEAKQSELYSQKKRMENIIEATDVGTWEWNVQTGETIFNERWAEIIGYSLDELEPVSIQTWIKNAHPSDLEYSNKMLEKHFNEETEYYRAELRMKHRDGSWIWVLDRGKVITWTEDGKPLWMFGTHKDITERKIKEQKIQNLNNELERTIKNLEEARDEAQKHEAMFRAAMENSQAGIAIADVNTGNLTFVNKAGLLIRDKNYDEVVENVGVSDYVKSWQILHFDGTPYEADEVPLARATLYGETSSKEFIVRRDNNEDRYVLANAAPVIDKNGKQIASIVIFLDITERKKSEFHLQRKNEELQAAEEELRASNEELQEINLKLEEQQEELQAAKERAERGEERYHKFIEQSTEGIYRMDLEEPLDLNKDIESQIDYVYDNAYVAECNRRFAEMYGASSVDQMIGARLIDLHGGKHQINRQEVKEFVEQGYRIANKETKELTFNNEVKYFSNNTIGITENGRLIRIWGAQADITERKIMEENLIKAKEKAEESDRLKSAFLANMSHEIRTPMNGIIGFSQMLQEKEFPREKQKKFLGIIHSRTQHLLQIISDIVDIAKIESGQLSMNEQEFCLNDLIKELYDFYRNDIKDKGKTGIKLRLNMGLNRDLSSVKSDPTRIRQVLDNLLSNAIKFTDEGEVEIGYRKNSAEELLFWVKDTGVGISPENYDKIFERFRQVDDASNRLYEGTGLGLTISKNLAELLGGRMWLDSVINEGSVFYFTLPYKDQKLKVEEDEEVKALEHNWQDKTILIVEDDPTSLEYIEEIINPTGAVIISKETGEGGYQAYKETVSVDLILMDVRLPDISGLEVIKRIRKTDQNVKIIAQTAHAMGEDRNKCLQAGADDYIPKPVGITDLLKIVSRFIG